MLLDYTKVRNDTGLMVEVTFNVRLLAEALTVLNLKLHGFIKERERCFLTQIVTI